MFLFANLYFLFLYHITNMYIAKHLEYEIFILLEGGIYTMAFWFGQLFVGIIIPIFLINSSKICKELSLIISSILILVGSFVAMYVIIIGGQAYPLTIFPDHVIVQSTFYDNVVHSYMPSLYELGLGLGGVALALIIVLIGIANFKFLPTIIKSTKKPTEGKQDNNTI